MGVGGIPNDKGCDLQGCGSTFLEFEPCDFSVGAPFTKKSLELWAWSGGGLGSSGSLDMYCTLMASTKLWDMVGRVGDKMEFTAGTMRLDTSHPKPSIGIFTPVLPPVLTTFVAPGAVGRCKGVS